MKVDFVIQFFLSFLFFIVFGCEKKIDGNFSARTPKLVINSILDTNTFFGVQLSSTSAMTDTGSVIIENAKVEIWENNQLLEQLTYAGDGKYKSTSNKPKSGAIYRLEASAPGFDPISATDTIPGPVKLERGVVVVPASTDISGDPVLEFTIEFNDPPGENYYEVIFMSKQIIEDVIVTPDTIIFGDTIWYIDRWRTIDSDDPVLRSEGDLDYQPSTAFFGDRLFNGQKASISIKILQINNIETMYEFQEGFETLAVLRSISYSYYQYRKKWTRHLYNQGIDLDIQDSEELKAFLFTGEPVNMYSNVKNGYGIFAGFSKSQIVLQRE